MTEKDMRQPVVDWLHDHGFEDAHEVWTGAWCDIVGFRFAPRVGRPIPRLREVIAIELKVSNVSQVIFQARGNKLVVNASYAAMPFERCRRMRLTTRAQFAKNGIGLLSVTGGGTVRGEIEPTWVRDGREQRYKASWWRWHIKHEKREESENETRTNTE